jgi:hypothetical protein
VAYTYTQGAAAAASTAAYDECAAALTPLIEELLHDADADEAELRLAAMHALVAIGALPAWLMEGGVCMLCSMSRGEAAAW